MAISGSTARYAGGDYMQTRWEDLANPKPVDSRSGNEIAAEVIKKAGLVPRTRT